MLETLLHAVVDRAVGEERCVAVLHQFDDLLGAKDVEVGLLLSGKGRVRQVLGGGARPDRHIRKVRRTGLGLVLGSELEVGLAKGLGQFRGHIRGLHGLAELLAHLLEHSGVLGIR